MVKKKNIKGRAVLSPAMKMADLVNLNYHLLSVLSRLGMDLGFGEITGGDNGRGGLQEAFSGRQCLSADLQCIFL